MSRRSRFASLAGVVVVILGLLGSTPSVALFAPRGESLGMKWWGATAGSPPSISATMDAAPTGVIADVEVRTVGALARSGFGAQLLHRPDSLVVKDTTLRALGGDTVSWSVSIYRDTADGSCPRQALRHYTFCFSSADTLRITPPPGITAMFLDHWMVMPAGQIADADWKDDRRSTIRMVSLFAVGAGVVGALLPLFAAGETKKPLDRDGYLEAVIAAVQASSPTQRKRLQTILGWALIDRMKHSDRVARVRSEFKVSNNATAAALDSAALTEFSRVHGLLQQDIAGALGQARSTIDVFDAAEQRLPSKKPGGGGG